MDIGRANVTTNKTSRPKETQLAKTANHGEAEDVAGVIELIGGVAAEAEADQEAEAGTFI